MPTCSPGVVTMPPGCGRTTLTADAGRYRKHSFMVESHHGMAGLSIAVGVAAWWVLERPGDSVAGPPADRPCRLGPENENRLLPMGGGAALSPGVKVML